MSEPKTKPTDIDPIDFIKANAPERMEECKLLMKMMEEATGEKGVMWGGSIIGFGTYHYVYASGKRGDWPLVGFSPRKAKFSIYIMAGFEKRQDLMKKLGKYKTGKSCLYVNKLDQIDLDVLRDLVNSSVRIMREKYN